MPLPLARTGRMAVAVSAVAVMSPVAASPAAHSATRSSGPRPSITRYAVKAALAGPIAVDPAHHRVYAIAGSNVIAYDTRTRHLARLGLPAEGVRLAVDRVHDRVYVAARDGSITVVKGTKVVGAMQLPSAAAPTAILIAADDGNAYVANGSGNSVTVLDGAHLVTTVEVGSTPTALVGTPNASTSRIRAATTCPSSTRPMPWSRHPRSASSPLRSWLIRAARTSCTSRTGGATRSPRSTG